MLISPFLLLNCNGKKPQSSPSISQSSNPSINTQQTQPSLGRPIRVPRPIQTTIPSQQTIPAQTPQTSRPQVQQTAKYGESYFTKKFKLPNTIKENSGLIKIDNRLWTVNDSGGKAALYQIDERNGRIIKSVSITNARNKDWEDIAYDDNYVYIGDFGNNSGNRKDLKVYKIPRAGLRTQNSIRAEVIHFSYSDQKDFRSLAHKNNYDCEAMIEHNGKLYLFSKNWQNNKTRLYELSKQAGTHKARYIATFNIRGMVTGASINKELGILLLTTYSKLLDVNVWAFTNHNGRNFFKANVKKLNLTSPLQGQIEGITFTDNYKAYMSSEAFRKYIFSFDATLYELDFTGEFE